jgi:ABC-2 type transport system ATP-binding protein
MSGNETETVIRTEGLGKSIKRRDILQDISVTLRAGQVVGLLGKNGAGKSTLLDLLLGFALPTAGQSAVLGHDSVHLPEAVKAQIGFVPQQDELVAMLTGAQQLAFIAALHRRWDRALIDRLVREWELPLDRRISTMSGGERQKLAVLLALGHTPRLLVLDEPASALDPVARRRFMQEILEIAGDPTRTLVYSTHLVGDLERAANHLWILRAGRLAWDGELDALKESVVRLHLTAGRDLQALPSLPNALGGSFQGRRAQIAVEAWDPSQVDALRAQWDLQIEVEPLGLEDIFLALHA